ncbi:hypothetical protein PC116_g12846 [Phytophthora cactorum]|uniref:Uncharacterized protein n=2 Tax=Phytophthora cactorum TaxID=29920 RepID=A0A329S5L6_9STRA|nr:hypothetical protein PC117_g12855 [Phytophthora cactorum]KAG2983695.1 hypothetical protein PC118_g9276 [Phytophthora cactorum]KAG4239151.1 hypothetical protein PC116_g12846 [Phytophthora cactorum]RAW32143.1 hypothetical protein PC110_g11511 [Phytophthora cactorum]
MATLQGDNEPSRDTGSLGLARERDELRVVTGELGAMLIDAGVQAHEGQDDWGTKEAQDVSSPEAQNGSSHDTVDHDEMERDTRGG